MEFKELPEYAQIIALQALKDLIVQGSVHEKEPAEKLAHAVQVTFVKIFTN